MEFQHGKNVRIIVDLEIGDTVRTDVGGYKTEGVDWIIEDIKFHVPCESGVQVKINGYPNFICSNWVTKVSK